MGRTRAKRLRGFGNAIVLPLATAFVASVIDAFADAASALGSDVSGEPTTEPVEAVKSSTDPADPALTPVTAVVSEQAPSAEDHAA